MAKNMARLFDNVVLNLEWHSDFQEGTSTLVDTGDIPVQIGDQHSDGAFYRNGEKVLTGFELLQKSNLEKSAALNILGVTE